ncbi:hypothetical protein E2C01_093783 [Portunus trituberculatus]|uniref:Uncharacterized protein n=1 Tax=Portunus trituberculatus TaxID=210409 RepID=A0A5B7JVD9_PORTR|nr:hypothetical protein [Portunus trituberculatus]
MGETRRQLSGMPQSISRSKLSSYPSHQVRVTKVRPSSCHLQHHTLATSRSHISPRHHTSSSRLTTTHCQAMPYLTIQHSTTIWLSVSPLHVTSTSRPVIPSPPPHLTTTSPPQINTTTSSL